MHNEIIVKEKARRTFIALVLVFVFFLCQTKVYAGEYRDYFRVSQNISINSPYSKPQDSFTYVIESLSKDAPLPEGFNDRYKFNLKSDDKKVLAIDYKKAGEYSYKLYQEKSNIKNVVQDKEVYTIIINIAEKNGQLVKDTIIIKNSSNKKVENMDFNNNYQINDIQNPKKPEKSKKRKFKNVSTGIRGNFVVVLSIILISIGLLKITNKREDKEKINNI